MYVYKKKGIMTKTEKAKNLFEKGELKKALAIFKTFKIGITKDQKRTLEIAHEINTGKGDFYKSIGIDIFDECKKANAIMKTYLLQS